ncbi:MAG: SDR family NAD(P)-dependent oxidoreductase [Anaerolineae bacterium]|nr:SDR family NAD(P)-dependent oxidoreductase [Anaerolineae bacterium]
MRRWLLWGGMAAGVGAVVRSLARREPADLHGQVVLITGASSGIGAATAHAFAQHGAHVALTARRTDRIDRLAHELAACYGVWTLAVPADLLQDADRQRLVRAVEDESGRIDVLVNNAGRLWTGHFCEQDPAVLQDLLQINLYVPLRLAQLVLPGMIARGAGHIVNVSSIGGRGMPPFIAGYVASKAGLIGFSSSLRREVARQGVHVADVLPAFTETPMLGGIDRARLRRVGFRLDPPDVPARAIVDAVRRNRRETFLIGPTELVIGVINHLAPGLMDRLITAFVTPRLAAELARLPHE